MLSKKIKNKIKIEALKKIKKEEKNKNKYHRKVLRETAKIPIEKIRSGRVRLRKKKRKKSPTEQIKILFQKKYGEKI